jgi:Cof subfamily protein (haloacid dehalogenase superfamily)
MTASKTKQDIRLVVTDLDGTFLDPHKQITPRAKAVVEGLKAQGIAFSACSGRPVRGMLPIIKEAGITAPFGALNGGVIINSDLSIVREITLSSEEAQTTLTTFSHYNLNVWLFTARDWLVLTYKNDLLDHEVKAVNFKPEKVDSFAPYLHQAVKIVATSNDHELLARLETELQAPLGTGCSIARSNIHYLDVTEKQANKGTFLSWLAAKLEVEETNIATLGDMPCDIEMFTRSGLSVAMGSATASVKENAGHVTLSNAQEGFAQAIEDLILG